MARIGIALNQKFSDKSLETPRDSVPSVENVENEKPKYKIMVSLYLVLFNVLLFDELFSPTSVDNQIFTVNIHMYLFVCMLMICVQYKKVKDIYRLRQLTCDFISWVLHLMFFFGFIFSFHSVKNASAVTNGLDTYFSTTDNTEKYVGSWIDIQVMSKYNTHKHHSCGIKNLSVHKKSDFFMCLFHSQTMTLIVIM